MKPTLRDVEWVICAKFKVPREVLRLRCGRGQCGPRAHFRPRQIAYYLGREITGLSYPQIGRYFNRDHTTVIAGVRRIRSLIQTNPKVAAYVDECRAALPCMASREADIRADVARFVAGTVSWPSG